MNYEKIRKSVFVLGIIWILLGAFMIHPGLFVLVVGSGSTFVSFFAKEVIINEQ